MIDDRRGERVLMEEDCDLYIYIILLISSLSND